MIQGGEVIQGSGTTQSFGSGTTQSFGSGTTQTFDTGSSGVIYDPIPSATDAVEPVISTPAVPAIPEATEGGIVIPGAEGASNGAKPVVDPAAFVIKGS